MSIFDNFTVSQNANNSTVFNNGNFGTNIDQSTKTSYFNIIPFVYSII